MQALRTPDERFTGLPGYPFEPHYAEIDGLRIHYPVLGHMDEPLRRDIPGAAAQAHTTLRGGGHFLQEDVGPELAQVAVDFIASTGGAA